MSLDIKDFLEQFVKPNALKLGGEVAIQDVTSSGGPIVPSTAKVFVPDTETIFLAVLDIVDNFGLTGNATYSDDSLWATFTASNILNVTEFIDVNDFYVNGFYNEAEYSVEGVDILNIGYSGVVDFNVLGGDPNPVYTGGSYYFLANVDPDTYDILSFVNLSVKTDVGIDYTFEDDGTGLYYTSGIFTNLSGPVVISFDIEVDVDNDTVDWTIDILGN
jgi:hypothetical protein